MQPEKSKRNLAKNESGTDTKIVKIDPKKITFKQDKNKNLKLSSDQKKRESRAMSDEKKKEGEKSVGRRNVSKINSFMSVSDNGSKKREIISKAAETHRSTLKEPIISKRKTDTSVDVVKDKSDQLKISDVKPKKPVMSKRDSSNSGYDNVFQAELTPK